MLRIVPNYYPAFACTMGACRHNCCIGWEIDIDEDTAQYYRDYSGPMTARLQSDIAFEEDPPHFILGEDERCPFLNQDNLCDIIIALGEDHICEICTQHPRFHNELPGRIESGLGMCCEEAARIILRQKEPVSYIVSGETEDDKEDEITAHRDEVLSILQNRKLTISQRIDDVLSLCQVSLPKNISAWVDFFLDLERLDEDWTQMLMLLRDQVEGADFAAFDAHMATRQTEYEQLLVYLIYRHMANAPSLDDADARAAFAVLGLRLIYAMGAVLFSLRGDFTFEDQAELVRLFSSEIEYSEENLYAILDKLYENALVI